MPQFCRHNRLIQNCPICSREQEIEPRPLVSSSAPRSLEPRRGPASEPRRRERGPRSPSAAGVTVRRLRDTVDDGYRSPLVPGLRSSVEAQRLAAELAFAQARLVALEHDPPGLYREVADPGGEIEERTWLAFLIAYLGPLEHADDPFAAIREVRTSWSSGETPRLEHVEAGPRTAYDPSQPTRAIEAYRAWARRAGSQAGALRGEPAWAPERRFARTYERLALPGLQRDARFELLASLGTLGVYELKAGALVLGGTDQVTVAAKRALGIGDPMLLERRAQELAQATRARLEALDLAFYNWERGERAVVGVNVAADEEAVDRISAALGL